MFVRVDLPDHAGVAPAGVHEVPDHPAGLALVDPHGPGAPAGPVSLHPVQDVFPEFLFRSVDFGVRHSVAAAPGHYGCHGAPAGAGVRRALVHNESRGPGVAEALQGDGDFGSHLFGSSPFGFCSPARVSAERCRGIFGGFFGGVFDMAGLPVPVVSGGFGWSLGLFSGPVFRPAGGPGLPRFRGVSDHAAAGPWGPPPGLPESWPGGLLFCPFCPAFSGPEGCAGGPGRGEKLPDREKRTCVKKVRGGIQLRVVGSVRSALCNERSFRTDVSICTIFSYGSARAGV